MRRAEIPSPSLRPTPLGASRQPGRTGGAGRPPPHRAHRGRAGPSLLPSLPTGLIAGTALPPPSIGLFPAQAFSPRPPPPTRQRGLKPSSRAEGSHGPEPPHQLRVRLHRGAARAAPTAAVPPEEDARSSRGLPPEHVRSDRRHTGRPGGCGPGAAPSTHQGHRQPPFGALPGARRARQQQHRQQPQQDGSAPPPPPRTRRRRHPAVRRPPPRWPRLFRSPRRDAAVVGRREWRWAEPLPGSARAVTAPGCRSPARLRLRPAAFPGWHGGSPPLLSPPQSLGAAPPWRRGRRGESGNAAWRTVLGRPSPRSRCCRGGSSGFRGERCSADPAPSSGSGLEGGRARPCPRCPRRRARAQPPRGGAGQRADPQPQG